MTPPPSPPPARRRPSPCVTATLTLLALLGALLNPTPLTYAADPDPTDVSPISTNASTDATLPPDATPPPDDTEVADTNDSADSADSATTPSPPISTDRSTDRTTDRSSDRSDRSDRRDPRRSTRRPSTTPERSSRRSDRPANPTEASAPTSPTPATSGTDFASFKLISERNIFNPNRGRSNGRPDRDSARRPAQVDHINLVGTMSYAKGDFAFFDGSSSLYRKTLKCGDTIAGYTVKAISGHSVKLEAADQPLEMPVGSQLRREDEGEWKFVARSEATSSTSSPTSFSSSGTSATNDRSSASSEPPGAVSDILLKLMQKREQEK